MKNTDHKDRYTKQPEYDVRYTREHRVASYKLDDERHRDDGPAVVWYRLDGSVEREEWYRHGKQHRDDGPAEVYYTTWGYPIFEVWYQHGKKHRDAGPAVLQHTSSGDLFYEAWYKNGVPLTTEQVDALRILEYTGKLGVK